MRQPRPLRRAPTKSSAAADRTASVRPVLPSPTPRPTLGGTPGGKIQARTPPPAGRQRECGADNPTIKWNGGGGEEEGQGAGLQRGGADQARGRGREEKSLRLRRETEVGAGPKEPPETGSCLPRVRAKERGSKTKANGGYCLQATGPEPCAYLLAGGASCGTSRACLIPRLCCVLHPVKHPWVRGSWLDVRPQKPRLAGLIPSLLLRPR